MVRRIDWPAPPLHPLQRRFLAEDLVRLRRSDETRRSAAPQRAARIDPNPHQIEAVVFALGRIPEGGCILADEVGLGKTIEAGLVMTQLFAEGARRMLLLAPKALIGQWKVELEQLFELHPREAHAGPGGFDGEGIFLINREAAGTVRGAEALRAAAPFELCVIDEAHETFAAVYKRFTADGTEDLESTQAQTAGRIREVLKANGTPVLLLTATPIQNNLKELWGLVQYVDPLGTLLGDLPTFREVFCRTDDRQVAPGQEGELRRRLKGVLQRTLRRQTQGFLGKPFVGRQARLFAYSMSPAERALYDGVTRYLLEPGLVAFRGRHRQLLLLGFHRRMASSTRALAASLDRVAARLRRMLHGEAVDDEADLAAIVGDLDDDVLEPGGAATDERPPATPAQIAAELARVEGFITHARSLGDDDAKFRALVQAITSVAQRSRAGQGSDKLVVFTESLVTQDALTEQLVKTGLMGREAITVFRGDNGSPEARAALERWRRAQPPGAELPSAEVAIRLALVDEFRTRSRIFISTEAGAKGLNLQFCNVVVNYDLPWNPQRIEQRIGRCHRYGQQHDVTVINLINKDNEAEALTFDILSQKLELFGTVLSASDQVLHRADESLGQALAAVVGAELEAELHRIYERARTQEEIIAELKALREKTAEARQRFEETREKTERLIESRFDEEVKAVFRLRRDEVPRALGELDRDLWTLASDFLVARGVPHAVEPRGSSVVVTVPPSPQVAVLRDGLTVASGQVSGTPSLHVAHPLVHEAIAWARGAAVPPFARVRSVGPWRGARARLRLVKATFEGFERTQRLAPVIVAADGRLMDLDDALGLVGSPWEVVAPWTPSIPDDVVDDGVDSLLFELRRSVEEAEQVLFERAANQADRYLEDRVLVWKKRQGEARASLEAATRRRDGATTPAARDAAHAAMGSAERELERIAGHLERLYARDDATFTASQERIHRRRVAPPHVEILADVHLDIE